MGHSFNKVWIHAIWATKERQHLISPRIEEKLHRFMGQEFREMQCGVNIIDGKPDHVHCLFRLNPQRSISEIIKQIKGSSSHYINRNEYMPYKFAWQTGYAAFSVSESGMKKFQNIFRTKRIIIRKRVLNRNMRNSYQCMV